MRRPTAIKLLRADRAGEMTSVVRARGAAHGALTHPNTISIFDYGRTHDGVFYYAMEFLEGSTLSGSSRRWRAAARRVVRILAKSAGR